MTVHNNGKAYQNRLRKPVVNINKTFHMALACSTNLVVVVHLFKPRALFVDDYRFNQKSY